MVIDIKDSRQLEDNHRAEAKRIAALITDTHDLPSLAAGGDVIGNAAAIANTLDAQFAVIPDEVEQEQEAPTQSDKDAER